MDRPPTTRRMAWMAMVVVLALGTVSCGDDGDEDSAGSDPQSSVDVSLPDEPAGEEFMRAVDDWAEGYMEIAPGEVPGLWVGVWSPDEGAYVAAYGDAQIGGAAAGDDDNLRIGSITKTFTATVLLQLVEEGLVELDQPVSAYVPDLAGKFPEVAGITVEELLSMTSGIPDYADIPGGVIAQVPDDPQKVWERDEIIGVALDVGEAQPAGTPGYSTTNYLILEAIAEEVTGQTIEELIAERATEPLGLEVTALPEPDDTTLPDPRSHGYVLEEGSAMFQEIGAEVEPGTDATDWSMSYGRGGGGIYSTVEDLGVWAASMSGNALLEDDTAEDRLQTTSLPGVEYGLGIMQVGDWFGHQGEVIGWEVFAAHNPDTETTVVVGSNAVGFTAAYSGESLITNLFPDTDVGL